jgi:hypothetical protein
MTLAEYRALNEIFFAPLLPQKNRYKRYKTLKTGLTV